MRALNTKHDLDVNAGLLYGIFSSGTCDRSTRRIQRIVQVGKKILKHFIFRSGDDDCVHCTQNCSTNANKQMMGKAETKSANMFLTFSQGTDSICHIFILTYILKCSIRSVRQAEIGQHGSHSNYSILEV